MPPGSQRAWKERPQDFLDVQHLLVSASWGRRHGGTEEKRASHGPPASKNPGDQSGRIDTEPSRVHLPKTLGARADELGAEIGPWVGRAPRQRGHKPP